MNAQLEGIFTIYSEGWTYLRIKISKMVLCKLSEVSFLVLLQCKMALKPDGLFLAAILGGDTLKLFIPTFPSEKDLNFRGNMPY